MAATGHDMRYASYQEFKNANGWVEGVLDYLIPIGAGLASSALVFLLFRLLGS